ncbi:MAG: ATP-binding protein [Candidatus Cyclobacteriaceae bacterium M2_1C_046]
MSLYYTEKRAYKVPAYLIKSLLITACLLVGTFVHAQDGIKYYELFKKHRVSHPDSALHFALLTVENYGGDSLLLVKGNNAAGYIFNEQGKNSQAIFHYLQAFEISKAKDFVTQQIYLSNNLGLAYYDKGDYDKSLEYHLKSLDMRKKYADEASMAISKNNLGLVYYKLKQYDNALNYFKESFDSHIKYEDYEQAFRASNNIGLSEIEKGKFDDALKAYDYVINNCKECPSEVLVQTYQGLGIAFYSMGLESMAIKNFEISEQHSEGQLNKTGSIVNNHYLSLIANNQGNVVEAREYLNKSLDLAMDMKSMLWLKNNYMIASMLEENTGNFKTALTFHKNYMTLQDSLINEQVIQNIQDLQYSYNDKKYQEYLASMDLRLAYHNKLSTLLGVLVFMFAAVGLVFYNSNKNRKRATRLISKAYMEVERQKDRLEYAVKERTAELNQSNEDLNNFIYKTSHDIRGPLATLKGICNIALMDVKDPTAVQYLTKLELTSERLIDILSRIQHINHIKNYQLEDTVINIKLLTEDVVDKVDDTLKLDVKYTSEIPEGSLIKSDANLLKIALRNVLHNAFKFSRRNSYEQSYVSVNFHQSEDGHIISVVDNGYGIEPGEINKVFDLFYKNDLNVHGQSSAGIGLHLAEMAITKLGGSIHVESIPMVKTIFTIKLPSS